MVTAPHAVPTWRPAHSGRVRTILSIRSCDCGIQGPENLILALGHELDALRVRYVIVNLWDGDPPQVALHEEAVRRGLESHVLRMSWGTDPMVLVRLAALMRTVRPDVVQTHDVKSQAVALLASRVARTALVGFFYGRVAVTSRWLRATEASGLASLRWLDRILANSSAQRAELLRWHVPPEKVEVVPSFVDTRELLPPSPPEVVAARAQLGVEPNQRVIATVARLSPNKGHTYLLQALVEVRRAVPDVVYLVAGDGDREWHGDGGIRGELERQTAALGLTDHVRFLGYYPDLRTVLHAADVLVSPSLREGMQVSLLEAMATGRAIVATAIGGTPDAVQHGSTGLLVPPADPASLAAAIVEILTRSELRRALGDAARHVAEERFDAHVVARQVLGICEEVVAGA